VAREFADFLDRVRVGMESAGGDEIASARIFLSELNRFLYQGVGVSEPDLVSAFHGWWRDHADQVLNFCVNEVQCLAVARILDPVFRDPDGFPGLEIHPPVSRKGVSAKIVANVRFFTAIQDFKIDIYKKGRNPFLKALQAPAWFDPRRVAEDDKLVGEFLEFIEATGSQGDKRRGWMTAAAQFLVEEHAGSAWNLGPDLAFDAARIREELASRGNLGYSEKKATIFLRDMADWGVWPGLSNTEVLNVASDQNTMRIALRTGILHPAIPLLASYLDVYCYQYGLTDRMTQLAWRKVWEQWANVAGNARPAGPASVDYVLYKSVGKAFCKKGHPKCANCLFDSVCPDECRKLQPPKSISREGQTGWKSGRTDAGGGGGIMS